MNQSLHLSDINVQPNAWVNSPMVYEFEAQKDQDLNPVIF